MANAKKGGKGGKGGKKGGKASPSGGTRPAVAAAPGAALAVYRKDRAEKKAAAHEAAVKSLAPIAKEIAVRLEKATKLIENADDHRLAASLKLAEAQGICKTNRINFKKWCEENVKEFGWENVRKLAAVGKSDNPQLALADLRNRTKEASQRHRAKSKTARAPAAGIPGETAIVQGLNALPDETAVKIIRDEAKKLNLAVVNKDDQPKIFDLRSQFKVLAPSDKVAFLKWAAEEIGYTLSDGFSSGDDKPAPSEKTTRRRSRSTASEAAATAA